MGIKIKTKQEIAKMVSGGSILANILQQLAELAKPGISTLEIDQLAEALCKKYNVLPAFKGYKGYGYTVCTGVDDVAVHGIPSKDEILKVGEIVSIDMGIIHDGYYTDTATTVAIGEIDDNASRLLQTTKLALQRSIEVAIEGATVGDIGYTIENIALLAGFNVVTEMTGHGIGKNLHEEPYIPCFGQKGKGAVLKQGMTIAIEPMINEGLSDLVFEDDGWTTRTADGKRSAIFEHTIVVGKRSSKILTI